VERGQRNRVDASLPEESSPSVLLAWVDRATRRKPPLGAFSLIAQQGQASFIVMSGFGRGLAVVQRRTRKRCGVAKRPPWSLSRKETRGVYGQYGFQHNCKASRGMPRSGGSTANLHGSPYLLEAKGEGLDQQQHGKKDCQAGSNPEDNYQRAVRAFLRVLELEDAAKKQYDQIAKGVFQAWRYYSHVRRGIAEAQIAIDAHVMVFTLDWFLYMSRELKTQVIGEAKALADKDGQITEEDRKPVVFCAIHELEAVLPIATEDMFLAALKNTQDERFKGWQFREVFAMARPRRRRRKTIPSNLTTYCRGGGAPKN
jgi:hypothetical protein